MLEQIDNSVLIGLVESYLKGFLLQRNIPTRWSFTSFTADFAKEIHLERF